MPWPKGKPKPQWWKDKAIPAMRGKKKPRPSIIPPWIRRLDYLHIKRVYGAKFAREWLNWKMFGLIEPDEE